MNLPLSLVIEGLVAVLLIITIGYCMLLNGRLKRLRADEEGLRATIAELLTATEIAERAIQGLKTTSAQCEQQVGKRLQEAAHVSDQLCSKLHAAGAVVERIGKLASAAGVPPESAGASLTQRGFQPAHTQGGVGAQPAAQPNPGRRLDEAARALQSRLQRAAS